MDKRTYIEIFEDIIDHYGDCKRWKGIPKMKECYECWQINSILSNIRALGGMNIHSTDREFVRGISLLLNKMDYHHEQKRTKKKRTEVPQTRPRVVRID